MNKILMKDWLLPDTQRPYVWGDRFQFEKGIYRLFDSLYRNYPIGPFLLWETDQPLAYHEFLQDFDPDARLSRPVEQGTWSRPKCLVYDGQQRLQSLYSCLQYTFCGQILCFDLLFKATSENADSWGFIFALANATLPPHHLRLNSLYADHRRAGRDGLTGFRRTIIRSLQELPDEKLSIVEGNVDKLWKLFNDETNEACGYFTIPSDLKSNDVQEIFVRLNTGGMPPSQADLVFSLIHRATPGFQARLDDLAEEIASSTRIEITTYDLLQVLYFIQYGTPRVDLERVRRGDVSGLVDLLGTLTESTKAFYKRFLHDEFQINSASLYRSHLALLPLLAYFRKQNIKSAPRGEDLLRLKQYFILSQLNDWSLQVILSAAAKLIESGKEFPLDEIRAHVQNTARSAVLTEQSLLAMPNFTLKILLPKKAYTFIESRGRLNPELEHIFPRTPREQDLPAAYERGKTSLWNLQLGVPGDINGEKLQKMPQDFFRSHQQSLIAHYDFLPSKNIEEPVWDYHNVEKFWDERRKLMLNELAVLYKLDMSRT